MKRTVFLLVVLVSALGEAGLTPIVTVGEMNRFRLGDFENGRAFDLTGVITCRAGNRLLVLEDETGAATLYSTTTRMPQTGDVVRVRGSSYLHPKGYRFFHADSFEKLGTRALPPPKDISLSELLHGGMSNRMVTICGTVEDVFVDEVDNRWYCLMVSDGLRNAYASILVNKITAAAIGRLKHAVVEMTGLCRTDGMGHRRFLRFNVLLDSSEAIRIVKDAPSDPFDVPEVKHADMTLFATLEKHERRRARGRVAAVVGDGRFVLEVESGEFMCVDLEEGCKVPECGAIVETAGRLETNLYKLNLSHAVVRTIEQGKIPSGPRICLNPRELYCDEMGNPRFHSEFFGHLVRLRGVVGTLPTIGEMDRRIYLDCDGFRVPVDVSGCPEAGNRFERGATVEVVGVVLLDAANWRSGDDLPRIRGLALVVRMAEDVAVVAAPPWWTPLRLLGVIGILAGLLVAILIWNAMLRVLVVRKSRAVLKEQAAKIGERLKLDERMRLAAELHDYLAQNLTVISYQVTAAISALSARSEETYGLLKSADRMLLSCRTDLRRCLWDLKSNALDEPDFAKAIEKTSSDVAGDAKLVVRFAVRRSLLRDSTAHAILSICRELVSNSVRHGHAKIVRIAGEHHGGAIRFSVRDDGVGFVPETRPRQSEGHFGLDGVEERIKHLCGAMSIESSPGRGTRIVITVSMGGIREADKNLIGR